MKPAKHIGIVAVSAEGAALCYRTICAEGAAILGAHTHPEVTMHTYSHADYFRHVDSGRWDEVGRLLRSSSEKLMALGAELLICPDNTVHQALTPVRAGSPVPWLHIAEEVATVAADHGYRRLGVLGTRYLMEGPVYSEILSSRGITCEIPDPADRLRVNDVIFGELVCGRLEDRSRQYFGEVIASLARRGCEAVVLGCTEIPLLITGNDSPLPTLDSTRILARAALREATHHQASLAQETPTPDRSS
jgi:aspartate racemase